MKKIVILFGSPHSNGHTKKLLDLFLQSLNFKFETILFDAYKEKISPCMGCDVCKKTNKCVFNDLEKLEKHLEDCDLLVIASPIYNLGFPAPLKAIFDRFQIYYNYFIVNKKYRINKNKKTILLLTSGKKNNDFINRFENQINYTLKYLNTKIYSKVIWDNTDKQPVLKNEVISKIKNLTKNL